MTLPAEVTTEQTWDRLVVTLRAQYAQVDGLYQRITGNDTDADNPPPEENTVTDPAIDPAANRDLDAELEDERRTRLDYETDGDLDGDYDPTPDDDPDLGA